MKVSFWGSFNDKSWEGLTGITLKLKEHLEKNGFNIVYNSKDCDLIHAHSSGILLSFQLSKLKRKKRIPVIYSLYSTMEEKFHTYIRNCLEQQLILQKRKINSLILKGASTIPFSLKTFKLKDMDLVIVSSDCIKNKLYSNTKLIKIGIDTDKFKPLDIKNDSKTLKVSHFGHATSFKGAIDLLKATKYFPKGTETNLYMTTKTEMFDVYIKKRYKNINLFGSVDDMNKTYNQQDIVVLPYRSTLGAIANPLVLLEAMACEKAIITTNLPNIKEITQDSALLVNPYSPKAIASAVGGLKDPELRKKLGKRARNIITNEYCQKKMFKEYLKVYEEMSKKL